MKVVDLRPWYERLMDRDSREGAGGPLAAAARSIADGLVSRRVARRALPPGDLLVVSVGNLRVGGTGKTPVVQQLATDLARSGVRGGIVTRGHAAQDGRARIVAADDRTAGDEARLLAGCLAATDWIVVQAARRDEGLARVRTACPGVEVVLLEDAHQSARMGRHCDVLILDRWDESGALVRPRTGPVLPLGPYRESAQGATRAAIWLLESPAPPAASSPPGVTIASFARRTALRDRQHQPAATAALGLVSGLARPAGFEAACTSLLPPRIVLSVRCRDHCPYDHQTLERVLGLGRAHGVEAWVTTAKDWVKLQDRWPDDLPLRTVELTVAWTSTPTLPELVGERLANL